MAWKFLQTCQGRNISFNHRGAMRIGWAIVKSLGWHDRDRLQILYDPETYQLAFIRAAQKGAGTRVAHTCLCGDIYLRLYVIKRAFKMKARRKVRWKFEDNEQFGRMLVVRFGKSSGWFDPDENMDLGADDDLAEEDTLIGPEEGEERDIGDELAQG